MHRELWQRKCDRLLRFLHFDGHVSGVTHNFYRYPARFSPEFVRHVVTEFSRADDVVLDPFMGGGTTIVEALASGRRAIGVDLNPLACFIARAKTTPLSKNDKKHIATWLSRVNLELSRGRSFDIEGRRLRNLPPRICSFLQAAADGLAILALPRERQFARCVLLRTLQWAVDCRTEIPPTNEILLRLNRDAGEMAEQLEEFCARCHRNGIARNGITGRRHIYCCSATDLTQKHGPSSALRPRLVVTSPPYPGVHVLYHRWQVFGRRETPAPYRVAGLNDGFPESYYTFGGRRDDGTGRYFRILTAAFQSVRETLAQGAMVVQLVAFSNADTQLPLFLRAMNCAGFREVSSLSGSRNPALWRHVPNRKWYTSLVGARGAAHEVLLCHRLST